MNDRVCVTTLLISRLSHQGNIDNEWITAVSICQCGSCASRNRRWPQKSCVRRANWRFIVSDVQISWWNRWTIFWQCKFVRPTILQMWYPAKGLCLFFFIRAQEKTQAPGPQTRLPRQVTYAFTRILYARVRTERVQLLHFWQNRQAVRQALDLHVCACVWVCMCVCVRVLCVGTYSCSGGVHWSAATVCTGCRRRSRAAAASRRARRAGWRASRRGAAPRRRRRTPCRPAGSADPSRWSCCSLSWLHSSPGVYPSAQMQTCKMFLSFGKSDGLVFVDGRFSVKKPESQSSWCQHPCRHCFSYFESPLRTKRFVSFEILMKFEITRCKLWQKRQPGRTFKARLDISPDSAANEWWCAALNRHSISRGGGAKDLAHWMTGQIRQLMLLSLPASWLANDKSYPPTWSILHMKLWTAPLFWQDLSVCWVNSRTDLANWIKIIRIPHSLSRPALAIAVFLKESWWDVRSRRNEAQAQIVALLLPRYMLTCRWKLSIFGWKARDSHRDISEVLSSSECMWCFKTDLLGLTVTFSIFAEWEKLLKIGRVWGSQ